MLLYVVVRKVQIYWRREIATYPDCTGFMADMERWKYGIFSIVYDPSEAPVWMLFMGDSAFPYTSPPARRDEGGIQHFEHGSCPMTRSGRGTLSQILRRSSAGSAEKMVNSVNEVIIFNTKV
jgi:hypothetical protein